MDRRQFLKNGLGLGIATGSALLPVEFLSQAHANAHHLGFDLTQGVRTLNLHRPVTGETLKLEYMRNGEWVPDAYSRICWLMRDVRAGELAQMDTGLIAIVDWMQRYLAQYGYTQPIHVTSGFRSPKTNASTEGAARNSQHVQGKALDIRIPGLSAEYLGQLLQWLSQGGVGTYANRNFVHLDTGRVRAWRG